MSILTDSVAVENNVAAKTRNASAIVTSKNYPTLCSQLVLSEIFPPVKGGSGKWLSEIYARSTNHSSLMVVGQSDPDANCRTVDEHYPHPVVRENLSMAFRGVAKWSSLLAYLRIFNRVCSLARTHHVSSVHAARPLFEGLIARSMKMRFGLPYLCFVHGEDINVAKTSRELSLLTKAVLGNADKLIANSNFTKELLRTDWHVNSNRIALMHPGVDCQYFSPPESPGHRQLFLETQQVLLTAGRLQERKGHDTLIAGLQSIRKEFPEVLYAIAGDGEQRTALEKMVYRLNLEQHVRFLGEIDDAVLRQAYRECDLFVLPNRSVGRDVEGFGIVLLEAQACGKPVIAGRSGGTKDALVSGSTGLLVDCQDKENPSELVSSICRLLADKPRRELMGRNARSFVQNSFDWGTLAKQAEHVLCIRPVSKR